MASDSAWLTLQPNVVMLNFGIFINKLFKLEIRISKFETNLNTKMTKISNELLQFIVGINSTWNLGQMEIGILDLFRISYFVRRVFVPFGWEEKFDHSKIRRYMTGWKIPLKVIPCLPTDNLTY